MENEISGKKLLRILIFKIFASDIVNAIINILLPVIISIRCTNFKNNKQWWRYTILVCLIIVIFNIVSVTVKNLHNKTNKKLNMVYKCYSDQTVINTKVANKIYRLNKCINGYILENKPVSKKAFDKIADFQSISFIICESIYNMLVTEYGKTIQCEITLMKKTDKIIKMISYANDDNIMPSSYSQNFSIDETALYFVSIFSNPDGNIVCLPDRKSVTDHFKKIEGSTKRENKICQYIGIPIKTNRNEIELLLQIDVSKEKVFGKNETQGLIFAKNIIYPYAVLLHKAYERDLIFSQYYDMITSVLAEKNNGG